MLISNSTKSCADISTASLARVTKVVWASLFVIGLQPGLVVVQYWIYSKKSQSIIKAIIFRQPKNV